MANVSILSLARASYIALLLNYRRVTRRGVLQSVVDIFQYKLLGPNKAVENTYVLKQSPVSRFEAAVNDHYLPVITFLGIAADNVRAIAC